MKKRKVLGLDGCKSGWVVTTITEEETIDFEVSTNLNDLWEKYRLNCSHLLIDMPIGLIDTGSDGRACDRLGRSMLSPLRHSSIFTPPCRAALYVPKVEASNINFKHTGKRLSQQTINIMPKMREVDTWLQQIPQIERDRIMESHPEVVFCALNNGQPLQFNKKKAPGKEERLAIIKSYLPNADDILEKAQAEIPRKIAQPDDLIDALVLALAGHIARKFPEKAKSVPAVPPLDGMGLPMHLFYVEI